MTHSTSRLMAAEPSGHLTDLQLELLKLYSTGVTAEELRQIRRLLGRYFGQKAIQAADGVLDERGLSDEDMDAWLHE